MLLKATPTDCNPSYQGGSPNPYHIHQDIWGLVSRQYPDLEGGERPYLFHLLPGYQGVLILSERPLVSDRYWHIENKDFDPMFAAGTRLGFMLRASPCRSEHSSKPGVRGRRLSIVQHTRGKLARKGVAEKDMPSADEILQAEGVEWLTDRALKMGFTVDTESISVGNFTQQKVAKGKKGSKGHVVVTSAEFQGFLTVQRPRVFHKAVMSGIGPQKGLGCGMMLLRAA